VSLGGTELKSGETPLSRVHRPGAGRRCCVGRTAGRLVGALRFDDGNSLYRLDVTLCR
jgi:hypothetical protein